MKLVQPRGSLGDATSARGVKSTSNAAEIVYDAIVVMLGTESILKWFRFFPVNWRTGATFVHDVFAAAVFLVVFGHIAFAMTHRDALRSMFKGWVTQSWAKRNAAGWLKELNDGEATSRASGSTATR